MTPRGLPRTEAATYIGCSPRKFDYMVKDGRMPPPRMLDSKKIWDTLELNDFFDDLPREQQHVAGSVWDEN